MSYIIHAEVKLDKKKCTDKVYFDRAVKKFMNNVQRSGVLEDLRLKSRHLKPSQLKKIKKQLQHKKWKFY
jgi:ribosomal protein S21